MNNRITWRNFFARLIWLMLILLAISSAPPPARAATFTVTNLNNSGTGSLRQAIMDANAAAGADTITFGVTGTITLVNPFPAISGDLTITGPGASNLTIDANNAGRVFYINSGVNVTISGVTLTKGKLSGSDVGGAIRNLGALTVNDCTISNNAAYAGSAINNTGTLNVNNSTFSGNNASDRGTINNTGTLNVTGSTFSSNTVLYGGIHNDGTATVTDSTFTGNGAVTGAGILNHGGGSLTVIRSTFSGNFGFPGPGDPESYGAGINNENGTATVTNCTFTGNNASYGGGIGNWGTLTVLNSTFSGNYATSGGGIRISTSSGTATVKNTITANNTPGGDCYGNPEPASTNNFSTDGTCPTAFTQVTSPQLALGALTGTPAYFPLNAGSIAIDAGTNTGCPATDQRGVARPQDGDGNGTAICDVGSFEFKRATNFLYLPLILR